MTESTITFEQQQAIVGRLTKIPHLAQGMGTEDAPCSIAAINLALTGELTDEIPECMSEIIGHWIIAIQDKAPSELCRDHPRWRELLPLAAGTGRELEAERLQLIIDWMWDILALPAVVVAVPDDARVAWAKMLEERTVDAAAGAAAAGAAAAVAARASAEVADAIAYAIACVVIYATDVADAVAYVVDALGPDLWPSIDPVGLLERLIKIGDQ